jgi:sodium-dependent phosphate transporter
MGGALLLGSSVSATIRSGIADTTAYESRPDLLMYGMLCALLAAGIWLLVATLLEVGRCRAAAAARRARRQPSPPLTATPPPHRLAQLPVSTTHSIVGAIIGMSLIAAGPDSVVWTASPTAGSPFPGGVVSIVLAWFVTPLMAALIAGLFFLLIKVVVLKAKNPFRMSLFFFPLNSFICAW